VAGKGSEIRRGEKKKKEEVEETFSSTLSRGTAAGHCLVE